MKVQSMKFLLLIALILLPIHGGKRGPKVYLQKDENSDEYKRATAFFRHRARPNECDVNEQSQQVCAAPASGNEPEEVGHMEVEEPNTNDEENSSEAVEAVGNPTENNGPDSDEICLISKR